MFVLVEIAIEDIEESNLELKMFDPLFKSQTFMVLSKDPETIFVLSGVIATDQTKEVWPLGYLTDGHLLKQGPTPLLYYHRIQTLSLYYQVLLLPTRQKRCGLPSN
jgi:hypothetical protein